MLKAKLTCVALALMLAAPAFCQQPTMSPAWNLDGLVMMGGRLLGKTPDDQDSILRVTGQKAQELRIARIRTPAGHMFIVQGLGQPLCSALGNCTSWVLDKDYHVLLTTDAESFRLQESQTPGQLDIVTYQQGPGNSGSLKRWQLDGGRYRSIACATLTLKRAAPKQPRVPEIQPAACGR
jgi:hypothetical protein